MTPNRRRAPVWVLSVLVFGGAVYASLFVSAISNADSDLLQGLTIAPIIVALTVPIALRIARRDDDPTLAGIILAGVVIKLVAAWVRYWVSFVYYEGRTDAFQYTEVGKQLAPSFRRFDFSPNIGSLIGTGYIKMFTGIVYAVVGTSRVAGFLAFAWIGFLGLLLMARAFRIGIPQGHPRRYLIAVLFVPSLVYWPSAIGKEAWMMLALGCTAYGVACLFQRRSGGLVMFALGMFAIVVVRPHIALIVFVGLVLALLIRRAPARTYAAPIFRLLGLVALLVLGLVLASRTASFLGQEKLTADTVSEELSNTQEQTTDGGSAFTPVTVNTPIDFAPAFVTVFFRPFPFEVSSIQELATAAEGMLLFGLLFASRKRLRSIPKLMRSTPYVTFCVGYLFAFVFAFSSFANFGILARQRSQAIPFLLVFLALPLRSELSATADETRTDATAHAAPAPTRQSMTAGAPTPGIRRRARRPALTPASPPSRTPVSTGTTFAPPKRSTS